MAKKKATKNKRRRPAKKVKKLFIYKPDGNLFAFFGASVKEEDRAAKVVSMKDVRHLLMVDKKNGARVPVRCGDVRWVGHPYEIRTVDAPVWWEPGA